jgi:hypothetical protein
MDIICFAKLAFPDNNPTDNKERQENQTRTQEYEN